MILVYFVYLWRLEEKLSLSVRVCIAKRLNVANLVFSHIICLPLKQEDVAWI